MAAVTSTTACAPITSHNTGGSLPELTHDIIIHNYCDSNNKKEVVLHNSGSVDKSHSAVAGLADKIHGLTERLHSLSYHRTESECTSRGRAGTCTNIRSHHSIYSVFLFVFIDTLNSKLIKSENALLFALYFNWRQYVCKMFEDIKSLNQIIFERISLIWVLFWLNLWSNGSD